MLGMKTTIALPDGLYDMVKHWAAADGISINSWMHEAIEREAFWRRCIAHGQWMDARRADRPRRSRRSCGSAGRVGRRWGDLAISIG